MSKRSKTHHFVPKVLQKRFCYRGNEIWFSYKENDGKFSCAELTLTDQAFQRRNYYTVRTNQSSSDIVEKEFYGKIDEYLGNILPDCFDAFSRGGVPVFEDEARITIGQVLFAMVKRTPDFHKQMLSDDAIGLEAIQTAIQLTDAWQDEHKKFLRHLDEPEVLRSVGRDIRVRATLKSSPRIDNALSELSVRWGVSEGKPSFLLSSSVVYRIGNGGANGLSNPNFEMWMPISPKIVMIMCRDENCLIPLLNKIDHRKIREFNEYAARHSFQIGSHSQKLIESIVGIRSRFETMNFADRSKI